MENQLITEHRLKLQKIFADGIKEMTNEEFEELVIGSYELSLLQIKARCELCRKLCSEHCIWKEQPKDAEGACIAALITGKLSNCPLDLTELLTCSEAELVKKLKVLAKKNFSVNEMKTVRDGEQFVCHGSIHTASGDAHLITCSPYEDEYVVYADGGNTGFFEEEFDDERKEI